MSKQRNIDIKRVPKQPPATVKDGRTGLALRPRLKDVTSPPPQRRRPSVGLTTSKNTPPTRSNNKPESVTPVVAPKPKKIKKVPRRQRAGFYEILVSAGKATMSADIFQIAFIRNLFSLRVVFFAILPIIIYQLRYILVLKPDELLEYLRGFVVADNTSNLLIFGFVIISYILISWMADTLVAPSIVRYRYGQLDHRRVSMVRSVREAASEVMHNVGQKLAKQLVWIGMTIAWVALSYVVYVLGYGSLNQQIYLLIISAGLFAITMVFYFALRYWLQVITAVGGTAEYSRIGLGFRQLFYHPLASIGYGFYWLLALAVIITINLALSALVLYGLENTESISLHIIYLSGSTTLFCIIWSAWTAWQYGFWTKIVHSRSRTIPLVLSRLDELKYWHFLVLIIIVLAVLSIYIVLALIFSNEIYSALGSIGQFLPESFKLNLPKP